MIGRCAPGHATASQHGTAPLKRQKQFPIEPREIAKLSRQVILLEYCVRRADQSAQGVDSRDGDRQRKARARPALNGRMTEVMAAIPSLRRRGRQTIRCRGVMGVIPGGPGGFARGGRGERKRKSVSEIHWKLRVRSIESEGGARCRASGRAWCRKLRPVPEHVARPNTHSDADRRAPGLRVTRQQAATASVASSAL